MAQDHKIEKNDDGIYDIVLTDDETDFESVEGLETAIGVTFYTDAREDEANIPNAFSRGGFSGNILTINEEYELGSTFWAFIARSDQNSINKAQNIAQVYFQWMIDDGIADTIDVTVTKTDTREATIEIVLFKDINEVGRYITLWVNTSSF